MFAFIMAMVSIPFAFLAGNGGRGAMAGVEREPTLAMAYWSVEAKLFGGGGRGSCMARLVTNVLYSLAGLYFLVRMRT